MSEQALPAVAKSVYTDCKKCGAERYHVVLAHTTPTSAKVECEICKSKKTYKLSNLAKRASSATGAKAKAPRGTSARSISARAAAHETEYQAMLTADGSAVAPYNMKNKFASNQKIQHPKFGVGIVKTAFSDKVEVVFPDEVRNLVHNRG